MKKLIILISVIISFFIFFLFMYFTPRDYEKKYKVDKVEIAEKYNKEKKYYFLNFQYSGKVFEYATSDKYINKRGLISGVEVIKKEDILCLVPKSKSLTTYPLCYKGNEAVDYNLVDINFKYFKNKINETDETYKDIKVNSLNDKTILVWNYKGFNYLNKDGYKQINLLGEDSYKLGLIAKVDNYLLVPDYDSKHSFDKMFIINIKTGDVKEWDLEYEIYFDSYIVGVDNKSVFLFDHKTETEYELRPDKMKMRKVSYKAIINDEWKEVSLGDLNKETTFSNKSVYNYEVINNNLYLTYLTGKAKTLISNKDIKDIIYIEEDTVYYLVEDKLYMYNKEYGEVLLLEYFEWNFNYKNMIYIY